jgi:hypothetical protein
MTDNGDTILLTGENLISPASGTFLSETTNGVFTYDLVTNLDIANFVTFDTFTLGNTPESANLPTTSSGPTIYYKMRGYYVDGSTYETYILTGTPTGFPPSGHTLTNICIISTWQE